MVWTYSSNTFGKGAWPPSWMSATTTGPNGTNNPVISAGLDYFIQQATNTIQYVGTNWAQVTNLAAALDTYDRAEKSYLAAIPDAAKMGQSFAALQTAEEKLAALSAAESRNVLFTNGVSLDKAYQGFTNQVMTYGMGAFDRVEKEDAVALKKHPAYPVFVMITRRLEAERSSFNAGLTNLVSPAEMADYKRLDARFLADKDGTPLWRHRWQVYEGIHNLGEALGFPLLRDSTVVMSPENVDKVDGVLKNLVAGVNSDLIRELKFTDADGWKNYTNRLANLRRLADVLRSGERPNFCTVTLLKMDDQTRSDDAWRARYRYIKLAGDSTKMENTNIGQDEELGKVIVNKPCSFQLYQRDTDPNPAETLASPGAWGPLALVAKYGRPAQDGNFTTWNVHWPIQGGNGSLRVQLKFDQPLVDLELWPKDVDPRTTMATTAMSEFYKRFLMEEGRRLNPDNGRFVALGAFGKHPGWDDHIEDLGLETDSLNLAKHAFYVQGVGGQIDTGAWEKLKEEQRLAAFDHTFVWQRGDQFLIGRMWSSSDGKGRTRYPMIVCAHCIGVPLGWTLGHVLPRLAEIENACRATKAAEEVRTILSRSRTGLRNLFANVSPEAPPDGPDAAVARFVGADAFGPANEGWFRILYSLQSLTAMFGAGRFNLKGDLSSLRAQQIRVPAAAIPIAGEIPLWTRFFGAYVDRLVPTLLVWPTAEPWLDVTFGEPSTQEFFCLRASRIAVPLATEIPYDIHQEFRDQAARQLDDFRSGKTPRPATTSQKDSRDNVTQSFTQRFLKGLGGKFWIFLIVFLVVAIVGVAAFVLKPRAGPEKPQLAGRQATQLGADSQPAPSAASSSPISPNAPVQTGRPQPGVSPSPPATSVSETKTETVQPSSSKIARQAAGTETARLEAESQAREKEKLGPGNQDCRRRKAQYRVHRHQSPADDGGDGGTCDKRFGRGRIRSQPETRGGQLDGPGGLDRQDDHQRDRHGVAVGGRASGFGRRRMGRQRRSHPIRVPESRRRQPQQISRSGSTR